MHPPSLFGRCVAGPQEGLHRRQVCPAETGGGMPDARQGCSQIAVDIMGQGLERRDVEHAAAIGAVRGRFGEYPVEGPEECGESLARPGGSMDQGVLPGGDGGPSQGLCRRGPVKRCLEPGPGRGGEAAQRVHSPEGIRGPGQEVSGYGESPAALRPRARAGDG